MQNKRPDTGSQCIDTVGHDGIDGNNCNMTDNCEEGIIELHDLRLSPIPSLRNRHKPLSSAKIGPPSLRFIRRSTDKRAMTGCRSRSFWQQQKSLKKSACGFRSALPKIKDVNVIDKYSRFVFPATFVVFNVGYWGTYILL